MNEKALTFFRLYVGNLPAGLYPFFEYSYLFSSLHQNNWSNATTGKKKKRKCSFGGKKEPLTPWKHDSLNKGRGRIK